MPKRVFQVLLKAEVDIVTISTKHFFLFFKLGYQSLKVNKRAYNN